MTIMDVSTVMVLGLGLCYGRLKALAVHPAADIGRIAG